MSKNEVGNIECIAPPKTKSGIRDVIVYDSYLAKMLLSKKSKSSSDVVFNGKHTKYLHYTQVLSAFKKYGDIIGVDVSPHVARHTYISIALTKGMDLYTLVEQVGHSNPSMILSVYGKRVVDKDENLSKFSVI